jgi:sulfoxide reductase catalytic subunit YedY
VNTRRQFIQKTLTCFSAIGVFFNPAHSYIKSAYAKAKRILVPRGTEMKSLIGEDPAELDTRELEIIPLDNFETMGDTEYDVKLEQWRLEVSGKVKKPFKLTYSQILELPAIERKVLMICPGFFSNHGLWKGISIWDLLEKAGVKEGITHVTLRGAGNYTEKVDRFELEDVRSNKVFLAYGVNGKVLPQKHGFPLRAISEDEYGSTWTKYVSTVEADIVK